jgi:hypothetical protein
MFRKRKQLSKPLVAKVTSYLSAVSNTQYSSQLKSIVSCQKVSTLRTENSLNKPLQKTAATSQYRKDMKTSGTENSCQHYAQDQAVNTRQKESANTQHRAQLSNVQCQVKAVKRLCRE